MCGDVVDQIRNKAFPWEASQCAFFDRKCAADFYAAKAAKEAAK